MSYPLVVATLLFTWSCRDSGAANTAPKRHGIYDCGTLALRQLLKLEGRSDDLEQLEAVLPAPRAEGYSMKELRSASLACGLRLTGVRLEKDEQAIDRPMLVYLKRGSHGHFLVVRPVGVTGKLVQIIDSSEATDVMDKAQLLSSREWTGLALIPDRPSRVVRVIAPILVVTAFATFFVLRWLTGRSRRKRITVTAPC